MKAMLKSWWVCYILSQIASLIRYHWVISSTGWILVDDPMESPSTIGYHRAIDSTIWTLCQWPDGVSFGDPVSSSDQLYWLKAISMSDGAKIDSGCEIELRSKKGEHFKDEIVSVYECEPTQLLDSCGIIGFPWLQNDKDSSTSQPSRPGVIVN